MSEWVRRSGIQLAVPFEEKRILSWPKPWIVQPKLDGDRCRALITDSVKLVSSEENIISTVPHIVDELERSSVNVRELDGELYIHGTSQAIVHGMVSSQRLDLHSDFDQVKYYIYDIPDESVFQEVRIAYLASHFHEWFSSSAHIKYVPFYLIDNLDELYTLLRFFHEEKNFEGFIIRNRGVGYYRNRSAKVMMKFKPGREDIYEIVEVKEAISKDGIPKGMVGSFECLSPPRPEVFSIGAGRLLHSERREFWNVRHLLIGKHVKAGFQHLTAKNGVPRSGVALEVLI